VDAAYAHAAITRLPAYVARRTRVTEVRAVREPVKRIGLLGGMSSRVLDDGRRVTLRQAVPSDAPRLACLGADFDDGDALVALDDRGAIVGYAAATSGLALATGWATPGLSTVLAMS
jgi:hypothetical protein